MKYKVTAILVTFNPDLEVLKLIIYKLQSQGCAICVINNSTFELENIDSAIKIFNFGENKGIAFAQNIGMNWAFQDQKTDFVLQMDQDSIPADNLVDSLISAWNILNDLGLKVGLIGAQDIDRDTLVSSKPKLNRGQKISGSNLFQVSEILSSGSLIPDSTFKLVGGMDDKLFIDLVDFEYCWRIANAGLLIVKNTESLIFHKLGDGQIKILGILNVGLPKPFRHYYSIRNSVHMILFRKAPFYWKVSNTFKVLFKLTIYPIVLPQGKERFKYIWKGFIDGIYKRFQIINA